MAILTALFNQPREDIAWHDHIIGFGFVGAEIIVNRRVGYASRVVAHRLILRFPALCVDNFLLLILVDFPYSASLGGLPVDKLNERHLAPWRPSSPPAIQRVYPGHQHLVVPGSRFTFYKLTCFLLKCNNFWAMMNFCMAKTTVFIEATGFRREANEPRRFAPELIKAGAVQINTSYENGKVVGLRLRVMRINGHDAVFEMPKCADWSRSIAFLPNARGHATGTEQRRISWLCVIPTPMPRLNAWRWRQLLRWVQAQNAMIDCGMVQPAEVFCAHTPYSQEPRRRSFKLRWIPASSRCSTASAS